MAKYKISKSNLKEFFGWFGKKKKPKDLEKIINDDPVLKQLDADVERINQKFGKLDPERIKLLKKYGVLK